MTTFNEFYWFCRNLLYQFKDMCISFFEWLTTPLQSNNFVAQSLIDLLNSLLNTITGQEYVEVVPLYLFIGTGILVIIIVGLVKFFTGVFA